LTHLVLVAAPGHVPGLLAALAHLVPGVDALVVADNSGFQRLHTGTWSITLCPGAPADVLANLHCQAHHVWVAPELSQSTNAAASSLLGLAKAVARLCTQGATLTCPSDAAADTSNTAHDGQPASRTVEDAPTPSTWAAAGFVAAPHTSDTVSDIGSNAVSHAASNIATYQPRWPVPSQQVPEQAHALVIGAGLAGAALCASLTRRGWRVDLLDQHAGPAQGASALPVGLLSAHVTAQETVLSELSRMGMALHMRELQALVEPGAGWQATQVSNLRLDDAETPAPSTLAETAPHDLPSTPPPVPQPAAMVRPSALVQAWLAQAEATGLLHVHWCSPVAQLRPQIRLHNTPTPTTVPDGNELPDTLWQALDANAQVLASAPQVVVTAAFGSAALLAPHMADMARAQPLRAVKGQMTYAPLAGDPLAPHPLRDHGVYVPCYEDSAHPTAQRLWTMGSTYERGLNNTHVTPEALERNAASLQAMLPHAHDRLRQQQANGELLSWAEVRCASLDRLPLVGAVPAPVQLLPSTSLTAVPRVAGLWTLCALGSRGLTLSKLAAELLVAQMLGEPWPVPKKLALALDPGRFALKAARKTASTLQKNQ
jgi:tRNA 5-methylaminomethyl-2-thiouridine biosynthesis bifunctional protein